MRYLALALCGALLTPTAALADHHGGKAHAAGTPPAEAAQAEKPTCKMLMVAHRVRKKVCHTKAEWAAERKRQDEAHKKMVRERVEAGAEEIEG